MCSCGAVEYTTGAFFQLNHFGGLLGAGKSDYRRPGALGSFLLKQPIVKAFGAKGIVTAIVPL